MPMDPQLAAIYGTNADESDVEKLAAAELAEKLAGDEDADIEGLTAEQAEELAQQILAAGDESDEEVAEEPSEEEAAIEEPAEKTSAAEEVEEEAQEKIAEADYLGRVMAHSYVQELRKIASAEEVEKTAGKVGDAAGKVGGHLKRYGQLMAGGKKYVSGGRPGNSRNVAGGTWAKAEQKASTKARAATAGGVAAIGGALGAKKAFGKKKKEAAAEVEQEQMSALDTLALARAEEILAVSQEQEKTSASEQEMEQLQAAVDARAMEMLTEAGYQFEEPKSEEAAEETVEEEQAE